MASDYCIVWLEREPNACVLCRGEVGQGPVGWYRGNPIGPICDTCLIDNAPGLGRLVLTGNAVREFAVRNEREENSDEAALTMHAYARLYDQVESLWPIRQVGFLQPPAEGAPRWAVLLHMMVDDGRAR